MRVYYQNERTRRERGANDIIERTRIIFNNQPSGGGNNTQQHKGKLIDYGLGGHLSSPSTHVLLSPSHNIISPSTSATFKILCRLSPYLSSPPTPPLSNQTLRECILSAVNDGYIATVDAININVAIYLLHLSVPLSFLQQSGSCKIALTTKCYLAQQINEY